MLKLALIGAGHLGKIHLRLLQQIQSIELSGFFDADPDVATAVENEFGIRAFKNVEELLETCEAVDIVTPTITHHFYACKALRAGKHVFIEKPICTTIEEAREIERLADEAGKKVQIGHVERFNPAFIAAKPFLANPMFIETHRLAQFNPRGTDVSVVLDLMIHDIDIVLHSINSGVKKISASGVAVVSDSPDIANARIEFDNGCVANLTASRLSMKNMRKTRFFQKDAYISVDFLEKETEVIRMQEADASDPLAILIELGPGKGTRQIIFERPEIEPSNAIKAELESFSAAISSNSKPVVSASDGLHALDIAYKIIEKLTMTPHLLA
ncbi:MAG: Gfo/Idh/MocA family oxidoreductase [Bacteroidia bacterium]|nr:Gfo/Idh/MocA family oxidoreductase [Bacteroidia bacterium]MCC6767531.1 Gfo/Idh/MocA family oxidoreductase [Bacteroidia bacterium]